MKKLKYTGMILDLFMPGPRKTKDDPVVVNDGGVRRPYEINADGAVMGALLGRVKGGEGTEEDISAPAYDYTPGSFGYGPFSYADFAYKNQAMLDAARDRVTNFAYDPESDTSYQAYARQYTRNGQDAYRNQMARLASRTGGVASTYALQAAQGSYNDYLQQLADRIPELEKLAYSRAVDNRDYWQSDYDRDLSKYNVDRNFAYDQYEDARDIAFKNFQLQEAARQKAYDQRYNADRAAYESRLTERQNAALAAEQERQARQAADDAAKSEEDARYKEVYNQVLKTAQGKKSDQEAWDYLMKQDGITDKDKAYIYDTVIGGTWSPDNEYPVGNWWNIGPSEYIRNIVRNSLR